MSGEWWERRETQSGQWSHQDRTHHHTAGQAYLSPVITGTTGQEGLSDSSCPATCGGQSVIYLLEFYNILILRDSSVIQTNSIPDVKMSLPLPPVQW